MTGDDEISFSLAYICDSLSARRDKYNMERENGKGAATSCKIKSYVLYITVHTIFILKIN